MEEAAVDCFRIAALDHLSFFKGYQITDSFRPQRKFELTDVSELLDNVLLPSENVGFVIPAINLNGEIKGFEIEKHQTEQEKPSFSMSLARTPILNLASVKGSSNNIPFCPGGFKKAIDAVLSCVRENVGVDCDSEFQSIETSEYLCKPPFYTDDVVLSNSAVGDVIDWHTCSNSFLNFNDLENAIEEEKQLDWHTPSNEELLQLFGSVRREKPSKDHLTFLNAEIEQVLRCSSPVKNQPKVSDSKYSFAIELDANSATSEYEGLKQRMVREYPFVLDPFQQAAIVCMENNESLFVAAHTSAGKTVVAEYAVALCKQHKTKAVYTSPIKALSNQKFRDFKTIFSDVGLITGDIQLNPEAFCLIMTTEILRSMLYNGAEVIRDLEWVIFDEVHYINNAERGHVWEEVLIMLPTHVKIVMLSATVPNCVEFADWVGRIKSRRINVIYTIKRPVPLEHYIYTGQDGKTKKDLFKIVDSNGQWLTFEYKKAQEAKALHKKNEANQRFQHGGKGSSNQNSKTQEDKHQKIRTTPGTFMKDKSKNDKNIYISLIDHLKSLDKLPMVIFVFSRKRCDENAQLLSSFDLTSNFEKGEITKFFASCINRLKGSDKRLPQVIQMRELCLRGFAVHHSGILPILKEVVELLFQQGLVKILFATETFAMGVNMPARTVVFDSITKHDGSSMRLLNTGEYIQMAGRAGRRGLDTTGTVIVLAKGPYLPEAGELEHMMRGAACRLESQFRVTYSMLLNLLRVEQLKVEDMLQRSYVESTSLRDAISKKTKLDELMQCLSSHGKLNCETCEPENGSSQSLRSFHNALVNYLLRRKTLWIKLSTESKEIDKILNSGRVLIISHPAYFLENQIAVLLKECTTEGKKELEILIPCSPADSLPDTFQRQLEQWRSMSDEEKEWREESTLLDGVIKYGLEEVQPSQSCDSFRVLRVSLGSLVAIGARLLKVDAVSITNEARQREIPRFRNNPVEPSTMKIITELNFLADSWHSGGAQVKIPGIDISISQVDLNLDVTELNSLRHRLLLPDEFTSKNCRHFTDHFQLLRSKIKLERDVELLKYQLSADALLLSEDYQNRLKVLKALGFVKHGDMVSFKGRVACEIHHQELLVTELILENKLHNRSTAEVAAMLSSITCQYKASPEVKFEPGSLFYELKRDVDDVRQRLEEVGQKMRVSIVDAGDDIRFDLMEVVYNWANGMAFSDIMNGTEAQEGLIVRCIQRLSEVCKDVRNAARIVGDPILYEKMEEVNGSLKRDVVFIGSLYTSV